MNFLEKDLETIIWENFEACAERGLDVDQRFFSQGKRYRQLQLAPYGIADLVNIHYSPSQDLYLVQVIELKKGKIDATAYLQAKRYQHAIFEILDRIRIEGELSYKIQLTTVLIGNELELSGDFIYCLNSDLSCSAFTYSYGFEGIQFHPVSRKWGISTARRSATLTELQNVLTEHYEVHRLDFVDWFKDSIQAHGDFTKPLLISSSGVLLNQALLDDGAE